MIINKCKKMFSLFIPNLYAFFFFSWNKKVFKNIMQNDIRMSKLHITNNQFKKIYFLGQLSF